MSRPPPPAFERRTLFQLTWPLFVFSTLTVGVTVADAMLLSSYSQGLAAAVSLGNQILGVAYDLSGLFGIGALVLIAQHLGRGETGLARRTGLLAILAASALGLAIALALFLGGRHFVAWVNAPAEIAGDTLVYVYVIGAAMAFNGFLTASSSVLRAFGHTKEILVLGVLANFLYLFLEYVLIYGRLGFPELGVRGAALSTLIVRGSGVLLVCVVLARRLGFSWRRDLIGDGTIPARAVIARLLRVSAPGTADQMAGGFFQLIVVSLVAALGTQAVLGRSYAQTISTLLPFVVFAIAQGNETLIGYDKGAGDNEGARRRAVRAALGTGAVVTGLAVVLYALAGPLTGLFTQDEAVRETVRTLLLITIFWQPLSTGATLMLGSLRSAGDVAVPVACNLAATWLVALPLAWWALTRADLGVPGLWLSMAVADGLKCLVLWVRWRRMGWAKYRTSEYKAEGAA